ncbi:MAG: hypothetical protein ABIS86_24150 [Streptosporangiaceae bacterium]
MRAAVRVLLALSVALAAWGGWSAAHAPAGSSTGPDLGHERDLVLKAGTQQLTTLTSMDHTRVDAGLQSWLNATTGLLRDQLVRDAAQNKQKIQQKRTTAVGSVADAAVTALDLRAGNAKVLALVRIRVTPPDGAAPGVQKQRYEVGLARTAEGWKLTSLTAIPVSSV